jgi:hypothetical protein
MQRAEEPPSRTTTESTRGPGLSPVKGFLLLAAILAVILGAVALTTGEPEQQATGEPGERTPTFALTDTEALERFEELNTLRLVAYKERDLSLLSAYLTSNSPLRDVGAREIERLLRNNVIVDPRFVTKRLTVISNTIDEIRLKQVVIQNPRFLSESGDPVGSPEPAVKRAIEWVLRPDADEWRIHNSSILTETQIGEK